MVLIAVGISAMMNQVVTKSDIRSQAQSALSKFRRRLKSRMPQESQISNPCSLIRHVAMIHKKENRYSCAVKAGEAYTSGLSRQDKLVKHIPERHNLLKCLYIAPPKSLIPKRNCIYCNFMAPSSVHSEPLELA